MMQMKLAKIQVKLNTVNRVNTKSFYYYKMLCSHPKKKTARLDTNA